MVHAWAQPGGGPKPQHSGSHEHAALFTWLLGQGPRERKEDTAAGVHAGNSCRWSERHQGRLEVGKETHKPKAAAEGERGGGI